MIIKTLTLLFFVHERKIRRKRKEREREREKERIYLRVIKQTNKHTFAFALGDADAPRAQGRECGASESENGKRVTGMRVRGNGGGPEGGNRESKDDVSV